MRTEEDFTHYIQNRLAAVEIFSDTQSSRNVELNGALRTASKNQTGKAGYPDHIALVEGFVLVMEDKSDRLKLVLRGEENEISQSVEATQNYALNGALFYARKIIDGSPYKKIFAFGNAGDRKHHIIKPIFVDEQKNIFELPPVDTFKNFTAENIESYYRRMVLGEESAEELELKKILRRAETLHEYLRNYGQLGEDEKPLVVSTILLALAEEKNFNIAQLTGDEIKTDGAKIFEHVENHLKRAKVRPAVKKEQVLGQFSLIRERPLLNSINRTLEKTPLKFFTEFIADNIYDAVVSNSAEDYLGRFYGEFISYSGDMKNGLNTRICFFTYDHKFDNKEGLYNAIYYNDINKLKFYRDRFKNVKLFIEPDYTICGDMHFAEKVSRRFKMRIVAAWLATELQAIVIPLITYGNEHSFKYMLDGIESSNTVAFSTKGSVRNTKKHPHQRDLLLEAIKYTVDNLNLRYIVVYSTCKYETTCKLFSYATDRGVQLIIPGNRLKDLHDKRRN